MTIENHKSYSINRIGVLYRDLLSSSLKSLNEQDKSALLKLQPKNKIIAIGDIDLSNWNAYPLTYLLDRKLVGPTVLDESKIYQSIQAMRTCNRSIAHPQALISESVVIRIIGCDNSANINEYINTFINMCIASDECKLIFVVVNGDKRFYKNNVYTRKSNSSFIDYTSADKAPVKIESSPLVISPDDIVFFNYNKRTKATPVQTMPVEVSSTISSRKKNSCASMLDDPNMF